VILKGNLHAHGMTLIGYMLSAEKGEAAEFVAQRGFDYFHHDPEVAADIMQGMAEANSKSTKPFFHGHLRTDPNERLTDAQWMEAIDRMERRAGFSGQPRLVTQHVNRETGERHFHVAWFRFDAEREGVINPGLYKVKFKDEARKIEKDFALRELSNDRRPDDRARAGTRNELEEARRLGTDLKAIRSAILDCFEKSDNGRSFAAAIRAQGMEIAAGDRRDCFVVIDAACGQHALNKKLTGMTLAEIRTRLSDLDRARLPGVDQAKQMQADRAAREAQEQAKHGAAERAGESTASAANIRPDPSRDFRAQAERTTGPGIFDRDAANDAWMKAVEAEAIKAAAAQGRADDMRPEAPPSRTAEPARAFDQAAQEATQTREAPAAPAAAPEATMPASGPQHAPETEFARAVEREAGNLADAAGQTVEAGERAAGGFLRSAAKIAEYIFGTLFAWAMAPTKLTPEQAERAERAEEEAAPARAAEAARRAHDAEYDEIDQRRKSARQLEEQQLAAILGGNATAEAQQGRSVNDRTAERERELKRE
jgi:MobA/VirD2-like, nuclease domain